MTTLDEIEARAREATPGPLTGVFSEVFAYDGEYWVKVANCRQLTNGNNNALFFAAARSDVPLLCRALRIAADEVIASLGIPDSSSIQESIDFAIDKWLQEAQDDKSDG